MEFPLEIKSMAEDGAFAGYASVFGNVDSHKDIVLKGAFQNNPTGGIKLLWQHQPDEPIGVITAMREDNFGLYMEGQLLLDVQKGREAYSLLKSGAINGLSIGYTPVDFETDYETGVRFLKQVELWEVSLVTFPANPKAVISSLKSAPATIREFEEFLRDAGYSRRESKAIALRGFNDLSNQRDAEGEEELYAAFERVIAILRS
jgi:HK97 family phage prohead protease